MILCLRTLDFGPYFCTHWNSYLILPKISISAYFISIGILIFFLQTLGFSSSPSKQWNFGPFSLSLGIMILFVQTLEFWPYFIHTGILTSSFETMEFWPYSYKHLPLVLSFHCNNWNSCPILPNINLNSAPIFIHIGILTSSFQTLQFWHYLYTH